MTLLAFVILAIYSASLIYITVYCLLQFNLLYHYHNSPNPTDAPVSFANFAETRPKLRRRPALAGDFPSQGEGENPALPIAIGTAPVYPFVTVQLPIYNELYVIGRLIDTVTKFNYPKDRFEIHILDDSTDETTELVAERVAHYRARGFQIRQIIRENRQGFKAGALRDGTPAARGEFIAIFDADFVPDPDFLQRTIPHFNDPGVGVVQTRWEHLNEDYSIITRLQALQLNVHFTVEQVGRMNGGHLLQFNGTAGVWRRSCHRGRRRLATGHPHRGPGPQRTQSARRLQDPLPGRCR